MHWCDDAAVQAEVKRREDADANEDDARQAARMTYRMNGRVGVARREATR